MNLLLVDNAHIFQTPDGNYYSQTIYDNEFFERYLNVFSQIRFVAKVKKIDYNYIENMLPINIKNVEIYALPWYQGLIGMLKQLKVLIKLFKKVDENCDCSILRIAQVESFFTYLFSRCRKKPFAVEVVNDPIAFTDMNFFIRMGTLCLMRIILKHAIGASYVTKKYLQKRYPCYKARVGHGFTNSYSSVFLDEEDICEPKKGVILDKIVLVHVSNVIVDENKGHKVVIDVVAELKRESIQAKIIFIGDGIAVSKFKYYARSLGIEDSVIFLGKIASHKLLLNTLKQCDLFVFPSKFEGLPRVIIEAMACGLPCIASPVGGINELIEENYLVNINDISGYVNKIKILMNNPLEYNRLSCNNIKISKLYIKKNIDKNRIDFYNELKNFTLKNIL